LSTKLSKYADKIRTIAKESSLDENNPDKYLLAIADAVENNKFQLSAVIESHINTRKELNEFRAVFTGDILLLNERVNEFLAEYEEHRKLVEQNINATTLFHQNMTDLLIAYFGIPKKVNEEVDSELEANDKKEAEAQISQQEDFEVPEIISEESPEVAEVEVPETQATQTLKEEPKQPKQLNATVVSDETPDGVKEFKPQGKKNDKN